TWDGSAGQRSVMELPPTSDHNPDVARRLTGRHVDVPATRSRKHEVGSIFRTGPSPGRAPVRLGTEVQRPHCSVVRRGNELRWTAAIERKPPNNLRCLAAKHRQLMAGHEPSPQFPAAGGCHLDGPLNLGRKGARR